MLLPWSESGFASPADLAACRAAIRTGSRSFFAASLLLPERVRAPAVSLYGFCRLADDAIDRAGRDPDALAGLRERLRLVYAGRPEPIPADRAFADVVARFAIPRALPEALLEGFAWDAAGRRYDTLAALEAYAVRVAGSVGVMMALLMGARAPAVLARACDLGVAMQLTNIARDVGEDARAGRCYLPLAWLREAGIDADAWLAAPRFDRRAGAVVQRLLDVADGLYARADGAIARLPRGCRAGIYAARLLYAEIGREVERAGLDSVAARAVVPGRRKAALLARALAAGGRRAPSPPRDAPPLAAARFLIAPSALPPGPAPAQSPTEEWWRLDRQLLWVFALFDRLQRRDEATQS